MIRIEAGGIEYDAPYASDLDGVQQAIAAVSGIPAAEQTVLEVR